MEQVSDSNDWISAENFIQQNIHMVLASTPDSDKVYGYQLVIMSDQHVELLKLYGLKLILIDTTFSISSHDLKLTLLLVLGIDK